MRFQLFVLLTSGLALSGCGDSVTTPTRTPAPATVNESFVGTLNVSGSAFYSFTVPQYGFVNLTLNSLTVEGETTPPEVNLSIGTPLGVDCVALVTVATGPGTSPQITDDFEAGVYCAKIADNATLTAPAAFDIAIGHP